MSLTLETTDFKPVYFSESSYSEGSPVSGESESSAERLSPAPPSPKYTVILVGDPQVKKILEKKIRKQKIAAQLTTDKVLWSRDCRVVRPDGVHILPAPFYDTDSKYEQLFYCSLPEEMLHFYTEDCAFTGRGFSEENYAAAAKTAEILDARHQDGFSCIEGGNCRIFTASDGQPKAIIGYNSLLLSFVSLYHDGFFTRCIDLVETHIIDQANVPITLDQLRIAKNIYFSLRNEENFDLTQNPKKSEESIWIEFAKVINAMLEITKEEISIDLGIPLDRIAFVLQEQFHIDLELFPTPSPRGDLVFVHDEKKMFDVQQKIAPSAERAPFLAMKTLPYTLSHLRINERIVEHNTEELKRIGCEAIRVPGALTAKYCKGDLISYSYITEHWMDDDCRPNLQHPDSVKINSNLSPRYMVNFMNGLYFSNPSPYFITSAPPKGSLVVDTLTEAFKQAVHEAYPEIKFSFLREVLPRRLIKDSGSINCMTCTVEM